MDQPATRIIIDMQPTFDAANKPAVIVGVVKEILEAIRDDASIIIVELWGSGSSHKAILDLVRDYPKAIRIWKYDSGGAEQIVSVIDTHKLPYGHFRVCGVNIDRCVRDTVSGLLDHPLLQNSVIEVIKNACGAPAGGYSWYRYPKHSSLRLK